MEATIMATTANAALPARNFALSPVQTFSSSPRIAAAIASTTEAASKAAITA